MSYISNKIRNLLHQLFPNGRAFWIPAGGWFDKVNTAIGGDGTNRLGTMERTYNDSVGVLDHIFTNSGNFTDGTVNPLDNDCDDWERRLGLVRYGVTSASTPTTAERKLAIDTKRNYPGTNRPRQAAEYLQAQLQSAGFNVYVYEKIFMPGAYTKTPGEVLGISVGTAGYGLFGYGELGYGDYLALSGVSIIANYIDEAKDATFVCTGDGYRSTFFIAGATITTFADVPEARKAEFRQQILRLKGGHMAGYLFVNYV